MAALTDSLRDKPNKSKTQETRPIQLKLKHKKTLQHLKDIMSYSARTSSSSDRDLTFEIVRDPGFSGEWLNRLCRNPETKEVLYYCDVSDDSKLEIHRGNKHGPTIARSTMCRTHPGATDICPAGRSQVAADHLHHDERTSKTHFIKNGRKYHWNGQTELVDDLTGTVVAELSYAGDREHEKSTLVIHTPESGLTDPIVMTAMMVQERSDEGRSWF